MGIYLYNVVNPIASLRLPFGNGLYSPFMVTLGIVCYWIYHIRGLQWEHIWGFGIYHGVLEEFFMRFFVEFYGPANCWSRGLAMKALVKGRRWQSALKLFEEAMQRRSSLESPVVWEMSYINVAKPILEPSPIEVYWCGTMQNEAQIHPNIWLLLECYIVVVFG